VARGILTKNYKELKHQDSGDSLGEAIKNVTLHTPISLNRSNYPVSLRGYIKLIQPIAKVVAEIVSLTDFTQRFRS